mgnify:CR=1 FL=1
MVEKYTAKVELGAMLEVPVYETHKRGKNWMATIQKDPNSPGGLKREFFDRAKGDYFYMVNSLQVGQAVEFGADYYSGAGNRSTNRFFGVVSEITAGSVTFDKYETAAKAIEAAGSFAGPDKRAQLEQERAELLSRLQEIGSELAGLQ